MKIRLATEKDLEALNNMYQDIVKAMNDNNIGIWNEYYPFEVLPDDIQNKRVYVLENDIEIVAACALCESNSGEKYVEWQENTGKVLYIDRLGVNANYLRQGIGGMLIQKVKELAKEKGAEHLRLFVVDINTPAINLYLKNGFKQVNGVYKEKITEEYFLTEFGFEMKV